MIKNCPPNPNIFFVKTKRIDLNEGATFLYSFERNIIMDTIINTKHGIPEKAYAKYVKFPEVVLVKI